MEEKNIIITTTDLKVDYEILDSLYVIEDMRRPYPKEEFLNQMLDIMKERSRKQCKKLGGDAVICCHIASVRFALSISGTAVKIKPKS